jgi:F-type H+-transporting ATPase subunit delta
VAAKAYPRRYAQAVFEIALEQNELDKWQADLKLISGLGTDADILELFESPKLSFENKVKIINERLQVISPMARNLAYLLVARNKMNLIGGIAAQYQHLVDSYRGVERAEVTTAIPLSELEKEHLNATLKSLTGKSIILETRVDPSIIGGVVARIDGKLLQGSTRDKLLSLKKELVGGTRR